jgi:hypothetical protein
MLPIAAKEDLPPALEVSQPFLHFVYFSFVDCTTVVVSVVALRYEYAIIVAGNLSEPNDW